MQQQDVPCADPSKRYVRIFGAAITWLRKLDQSLTQKYVPLQHFGTNELCKGAILS
jgi:hypothetical protein